MTELPQERLPVDVTIDDLPSRIKIRSIALMMAQRHHEAATIKTADMYQTIKMHSNTEIRPLSDEHLVKTAVKFERFLLGEYSREIADEVIRAVAKEYEELLGDPPAEAPAQQGDRA